MTEIDINLDNSVEEIETSYSEVIKLLSKFEVESITVDELDGFKTAIKYLKTSKMRALTALCE